MEVEEEADDVLQDAADEGDDHIDDGDGGTFEELEVGVDSRDEADDFG